MALGHVTELRRDDGRVNDLVGDHLASLLVTDSLHKNELLSFIVLDDEGIAVTGVDDLTFLRKLVAGKGQISRQLLSLYGLYLL